MKMRWDPALLLAILISGSTWAAGNRDFWSTLPDFGADPRANEREREKYSAPPARQRKQAAASLAPARQRKQAAASLAPASPEQAASRSQAKTVTDPALDSLRAPSSDHRRATDAYRNSCKLTPKMVRDLGLF